MSLTVPQAIAAEQSQDMALLVSQGLVRYPLRVSFEHGCLTEKQEGLFNWFLHGALCYLSNRAMGNCTRITRIAVLDAYFDRTYGKGNVWVDKNIELIRSQKNDKKRIKSFDSLYVAMMREPYPDCNPDKDQLSRIFGRIDQLRAEYQAANKVKLAMLEVDHA